MKVCTGVTAPGRASLSDAHEDEVREQTGVEIAADDRHKLPGSERPTEEPRRERVASQSAA